MSNSERAETERRATTMAKPTGRRGNERRVLGAVAVVLILVSSALALYGLPGASASGVPTGPTGASASAATAVTPAKTTQVTSPVVSGSGAASSGLKLSPHSAGAPSATGRGTFLQGTNLSLPSASNLSCFKSYYFYPTGTCPNTTFDPSINVTSTGEIGVAFTAFTNYTNCPSVFNISNNTTLDVAFQGSSNGGLSWSPIVYLGNQNCSEAQNLSDAWEPSLTSLSNGTLVVTYTMFSVGSCPYYYCSKPYAPDIYPYEMPYTALVVQESYNGGSTWTTPLVLNQTYNANAVDGNCVGNGWPAYRPWIAAYGNSLYLAWENLSDQETCSAAMPFSSGINFVESTNGGANWSSPILFPSIGDGGNPVYGSYQTSFSVNPFVYAASNGQVYVTYGTGLGYQNTYCQPTGCAYGIYTQDVIVANATGGTGNWTVNVAARNVPFDYYDGSGSYYGPFGGIAPQLAWDGVHHQVDLVYNTLSVGDFCYDYGTVTYCYTDEYEDVIAFQNSSNLGVNWSTPEEVGNLVDPYGGTGNAEYYPTIVVDQNGTAQLTFQLYNDSICSTVAGYLECGAYQQEYANSTNNGTSWNGPFVVSAYFIPPNDYAYTGEYESAATAPSGTVYFAWTNSECPSGSTATYCDYGDPYSPEPNTTVVVSWLYSGLGISLSFREWNLTSSSSWAAELLGNVRQAPAGTTLVVSGVPPAEPMYLVGPLGELHLRTHLGVDCERHEPGASHNVPGIGNARFHLPGICAVERVHQPAD